jgi:hemerythrin superfamily protein
MTSTKMDSSQDVVSFLTSQHEQIKTMFNNVTSKTGSEREEAFVELRRLLAVHEAAEEEIVHPRAKKEISDASVVEARLHEEQEAKQMLTELEKLDIESPEFETKFRAFQSDVIAHAEAEEHEEFNKLQASLDDSQLQRMRKAVEMAEAIAPTRAHPMAGESATVNMLAGPFASMLDRARDALSGKG